MRLWCCLLDQRISALLAALLTHVRAARREYGNDLLVALQFGGMDVSDAKRLKELEKQNCQLSRWSPTCSWTTGR